MVVLEQAVGRRAFGFGWIETVKVAKGVLGAMGEMANGE
jgi:hypothetical protein